MIYAVILFIVPVLISLGMMLLRYGISAIYEARKLQRPDIRDKEGIRKWLENVLRWAAYLQNMFFSDLATPAFTLGVLLELVKPGPRWDALYAAICHDFNISTTFPPSQYQRLEPDDKTRDRLLQRLCARISNRFSDGDHDEYHDVAPSEIRLTEEYLAVIYRMMSHPVTAENERRIFANLKNSRR